jgi:hypothetical protein
MTEYNSGARSFILWHVLASDSLRISLSVVFLSKDGLLDELISQHSTDSCFNMHLMSSDLREDLHIKNNKYIIIYLYVSLLW